MTKAFHTEKHILKYLGLSFDPAADYSANTKLLIADLIRYRGQGPAVIAVDDVIKLVKRRIRNPNHRPVGFDLVQQEAFLVWLKDLRQQLGPKVTKPKPKPLSKGLRVEARKRKAERRAQVRARSNPGYLTRESHAYDPKPRPEAVT
jgi:hypothetical protein